jgi:hypothetical protein
LLLAETQLRAFLESITAVAVAQEAEEAAPEAEGADMAVGPPKCDAGSISAGSLMSNIPSHCSSMLQSE